MYQKFAKLYSKKLQEKIQENPYFSLNYKENSGFPGFFPGVFFYEYSYIVCSFGVANLLVPMAQSQGVYEPHRLNMVRPIAERKLGKNTENHHVPRIFLGKFIVFLGFSWILF